MPGSKIGRYKLLEQIGEGGFGVVFMAKQEELDPAFVAEMPGSRGVVLKISHFDEVAGIIHVEI